MELFTHLNYLAVLISAVVYFAIGAVWYGPLFSKAWTEQLGIKMGGQATPPVLPMAGQFISTILYALGIAILIQIMGKTGLLTGIVTGLGVIVLFVFPINSGVLFFQQKPKLFSIDAGYEAVGALVIGIILAVWR